jgi:uncharacterized protein YggU (UPF0235/DUF167 family)
MARIPLWVKPASTKDRIEWDPWRKRWVVSCRAAPTGGAANRAVAILVADWLGLPHSAVHWVQAGASRAKILQADDLTDLDATKRLQACAQSPETGGRPPR